MFEASHYEEFLRYIQLEKRYSPHTLTAYRHDLEEFFLFLQSVFNTNSLQEINHSMIRTWMVKMMDESFNTRSINRKLTTLRSYYKYLLRHGLTTQNPMLKIQAPKNSKRLPVFVEKDKMNFLFDKIEFGDGFEALRNRLILETFYSTGMRLSELLNLKMSNIDLSESQLKVLGKRNKERIIPFSPSHGKLISKYIDIRKSEGIRDENELLFVSLNGKKLYPKLIYRLVVHYLSEVTTLEKKSPHVLRHTFATHMLNNGADINAIKELLGHANLSATQIYTHNTIEKLKNIHKQAHPKS